MVSPSRQAQILTQVELTSHAGCRVILWSESKEEKSTIKWKMRGDTKEGTSSNCLNYIIQGVKVAFQGE